MIKNNSLWKAKKSSQYLPKCHKEKEALTFLKASGILNLPLAEYLNLWGLEAGGKRRGLILSLFQLKLQMLYMYLYYLSHCYYINIVKSVHFIYMPYKMDKMSKYSSETKNFKIGYKFKIKLQYFLKHGTFHRYES